MASYVLLHLGLFWLADASSLEFQRPAGKWHYCKWYACILRTWPPRLLQNGVLYQRTHRVNYLILDTRGLDIRGRLFLLCCVECWAMLLIHIHPPVLFHSSLTGVEEWASSHGKAPSARTTKAVYRDQPYSRYWTVYTTPRPSSFMALSTQVMDFFMDAPTFVEFQKRKKTATKKNNKQTQMQDWYISENPEELKEAFP